jgi:hypothetical protein
LLENLVLGMNGTSEMPEYAVNLAPSEQAGEGQPGTSVNYTLTVNNMGTSPDTYDILCMPGLWPASVYDSGMNPISEIGPIPAGGTVDIIVRVDIPSWAAPFDSDITSVGIFSINDPFSYGTAEILTSVPGDLDFLETTFLTDNGACGNMFDLEVKTDGLTIRSIDVHVDNLGVSVTFDLYYIPGTYLGHETVPSAGHWQEQARASLVGRATRPTSTCPTSASLWEHTVSIYTRHHTPTPSPSTQTARTFTRTPTLA